MKSKVLTVFLIMAIFLSACIVDGDTPSLTLNNTHWVLEQINGQAVVADTLPTLSFNEEQKVAGNASCNNFFGNYTLDGNKLSFGSLGSTQMFCAVPEGSMDQESAYLAALESAAGYRSEDGKLLIVDASDNTVLVFAPQDMGLEGASWNLTMLNDGQSLVSLVNNTEINAEFKDGSVAGSSGCNSYNGPFQQDGLNLTFGNLASTLMLCQEEGVMEQETAYLQAIAKVTHYLIEGKQLTLYDADNLVLATFNR
ncbi:MAG: META domain-containing protein [Anaerolineaceae bacterium]|nr:META domain-containing protein [Anaerolineaceae bacterium]